jgi:hypothetical protein
MDLFGIIFFVTLPYFFIKSCIQASKQRAAEMERKRKPEACERDIEEFKERFH